MTLELRFHNVGHGQAVHIFTPDSKVVVVDLGSSEDFSPLRWLRSYTDTIHKLIITHPHGDHISEILQLDRMGFNIHQLWCPRWLSRQDVLGQNQPTYRPHLDRYFSLVAEYNADIAEGQQVGDPAVTGGAEIRQFVAADCGTSAINNHSGVVVVTYAESTVMIPGDNEPPSWNSLLTQPQFMAAALKTDVFMASHHGRESGHCADIFALIKPVLCVVSDGRVMDTDCTSRYSGHASGWTVFSRSSPSREERNCVTTRCDGAVEVQLGYNPQAPFIQVTVA
jgi:beta-lactamase superfamily II metal-dependent hydrolase